MMGGHTRCRMCRSAASPSVEVVPPPPPPLPSPPLFDRTNALLSPLNDHQRWSIITLYKEKYSVPTIAQRIPCSLKTVNHWINHYEQNESVEDKPIHD